MLKILTPKNNHSEEERVITSIYLCLAILSVIIDIHQKIGNFLTFKKVKS